MAPMLWMNSVGEYPTGNTSIAVLHEAVDWKRRPSTTRTSHINEQNDYKITISTLIDEDRDLFIIRPRFTCLPVAEIEPSLPESACRLR